VDEFPDAAFYVLNEPAMTAAEPDDIGIWQELAHLRTENQAWRECVQGILRDVEQYHGPGDALQQTVMQRLASLGARIAKIHHW
jgi:hypothetical protein